MSQLRRWFSYVFLGLVVVTPSRPAAADCLVRDFGGTWSLTQANGYVLDLSIVTAPDGYISGTARYKLSSGKFVVGPVSGRASADAFKFAVRPPGHDAGEYSGKIGPDGRVTGFTSDLKTNATASFTTGRRFPNCLAEKTPPEAPAKQVKQLVKKVQYATAIDDNDIYDGPDGEKFKKIGMMNRGQTVPAPEKKDGWYRVIVSGIPGGTGWAAEDHLTISMKHEKLGQ